MSLEEMDREWGRARIQEWWVEFRWMVMALALGQAV